MNAELACTASPSWAALRLWAANLRDRLAADDPRQSEVAALLSTLNAQHALGMRQIQLADELGRLAQQIAERIVL